MHSFRVRMARTDAEETLASTCRSLLEERRHLSHGRPCGFPASDGGRAPQPHSAHSVGFAFPSGPDDARGDSLASKIGTLPADDQLDRAVRAHEAAELAEVAQRKQIVLRLIADPEVYEHRLAERGAREYDRWYKVRGKWIRMTNTNQAHAASAAVNEGSIKALRTTLPADHPAALTSLPDRPSVAWLQTVDKRAAIDQGRTETAESEKRRGIWRRSVENVDNFDLTKPSRPTPPRPPEVEASEAQDGQ